MDTKFKALTLTPTQMYVWAITASTAALHLLVAGRYDFMRNELYFLVCGRHPDFGYADHPPLVPLIAAATQAFGLNLWLLRAPAVIAGAALVPLTAALARELGARAGGIVTAALAAAIAPALAGTTAVLTTQTFEPLAWTACSLFVARAVTRNEPRALLWAGLVTGIAMQAKYGVLMWTIPLIIGLLVTPARSVMASGYCWLGAGIAALIAAPSLIWQWLHGWPFVIALLHHASQNLPGTPWRFELLQFVAINPLLLPLCIAGVIAPFTTAALKQARFLSIAFIAATALDIAAVGKDYYLFPVYPTMFAVGAVALADVRAWLRGLWLSGAVAVSALMAPVVLPILPAAMLAQYLSWSHLKPPPDETAGVGAPLTQMFSDEFGWRELERNVASIYQSLPSDERQKAAILAVDYGEAAAIDTYGKDDGLPPVLSGEDQYWLWGTHGFDGSVIIHIGGTADRWQRLCRSVTMAGTFGAPYAMPYENGRPIFICRGLRIPFESLWPRLQRYL